MIPHRSFVSNVDGINKFDGGTFSFLDTDYYISYLPLAHVFERFNMIACMSYRVHYGFY